MDNALLLDTIPQLTLTVNQFLDGIYNESRTTPGPYEVIIRLKLEPDSSRLKPEVSMKRPTPEKVSIILPTTGMFRENGVFKLESQPDMFTDDKR